jgi:hypothetical protein
LEENALYALVKTGNPVVKVGIALQVESINLSRSKMNGRDG